MKDTPNTNKNAKCHFQSAYKILFSTYGIRLKEILKSEGHFEMADELGDILTSHEIKSEDAQSLAMKIVDTYPLEPPRPEQLRNTIIAFKEGADNRIIGEEERALETECQNTFKFMLLKYGRFFRNETFKLKDQYEALLMEIKEAKLAPEDLKNGVRAVLSKPEYEIYPPSSGELIQICRTTKLGLDIPSFKEAHVRCLERNLESDENPVVLRLRQKFDYNRIIGQYSAPATKTAMELEYHKIIRNALNGELIFDNTNLNENKQKNEENEPELPPEVRAGFLRSLI